ncbi:hypothetical protein FLT43_00010 [Paenibacillus thiaminolyticus]|uniref:Glycosyl hydrolase family 95 catalytic domain-containing protein n=1 Tax=Paenibacillus thiaminolyticus TaxID=49283 RepID=A0AAP9DQB6_PANTH|nr:hypothetical protein [Paenibacillus thiaminolyticus]QDM42074.1 hypothetical protein FLT43_00010 [Paenibacillus thiaminolyticus]
MYWTRFWERSSVSLPDPLLEDLWHINLYAIACSSEGGRMAEQACGLNGLWDIKQPTKWGSMWYWDVNIQAAFWPLYTTNHLEIAEVFHDGLLSYADEAERMARNFTGWTASRAIIRMRCTTVSGPGARNFCGTITATAWTGNS